MLGVFKKLIYLFIYFYFFASRAYQRANTKFPETPGASGRDGMFAHVDHNQLDDPLPFQVMYNNLILPLNGFMMCLGVVYMGTVLFPSFSTSNIAICFCIFILANC